MILPGPRCPRCAGSALLAVTLSLLVIASVAYLLTIGSSIDVALADRVKDVHSANYIAEAGFQHLRESLRVENCTSYKDLGVTSFGDGQYSASVTPKFNSPVTVVATGQTGSGASFALLQTRVRVFDAPLSTEISPGPSVDDTWINKSAPWFNYGKSGRLEIGDFGTEESYGLIRFNISAIPPGALINAASIRLYFAGASVQPPGSGIFAHRIEKFWDEGRKQGTVGDGATWLFRDLALTWDSAGGDYVAGSVSFMPLGAASSFHFSDITLIMQEWIDGTAQNHGVLLRSSAGVKQAEFMTGDESSQSLRPRLLVSYACECGAPGC